MWLEEFRYIQHRKTPNYWDNGTNILSSNVTTTSTGQTEILSQQPVCWLMMAMVEYYKCKWFGYIFRCNLTVLQNGPLSHSVDLVEVELHRYCFGFSRATRITGGNGSY